MPDLDTGVVDLCRRNPRKRKSKTRPFRYMTSMPPNAPCAAFRTKAKANFAHLSPPFHRSSTQLQVDLSYGTMASVDVIAITKLSSYPGASIFLLRVSGYLDIVGLPGDVSSSRYLLMTLKPRHTLGAFFCPLSEGGSGRSLLDQFRRIAGRGTASERVCNSIP